jgi:prevent-host-death family protein
MKYSTQIKPISYLKANASEIIKNLHQTTEPVVITQNGEAKAVLQDIKQYEQMQETLALLKLLSLSEREVEHKKCRPAQEVFTDLSKVINE